MRYRIALLFLVLVLCGALIAEAGHGLEEYPSFYPQEIRFETLDPVAAAQQLQDKSLHAYIGQQPRFTGQVPAYLKFMPSLRAYVVMTVNPARLQTPQARCAAARRVLAALADTAAFIFHPYPITPYHEDYLAHFDRVRAARAAFQQPPDRRVPMPRVRARGRLAERLVPSRWHADATHWDVMVEEIPLHALLATAGYWLNGWFGPPWLKEGWFQAYQLLAGALRDARRKRTVTALYRRLVHGDYTGLAEQLDLERRLVSGLTATCERLVIGYTLRREYYSDDYSEGIENVAVDAHFGFASPLFMRTVKLKDFLWNGWLRLGRATRPLAAWNPVAGFTDPAGRLLWWTVGEPALFPVPYNASWVPNRVGEDLRVQQDEEGKLAVPADAMLPDPKTGVFRAVGEGKYSAAKVQYRVLTSKFHDGTQMDEVDALYPYIFAYRWGVRRGPHDTTYDPTVAAATALLRARLVGIKVVGVEEQVRRFAEIRALARIPHVEVYVNYRSADPRQVAALAPPWSSLPWHVLVLMEEAVQRGWAAFSQAEAARRGVPWLDLVRDTSLRERLLVLVTAFAQQGYRPTALQKVVTVEAARRRWQALKAFAKAHHHFLVTNGPYRLSQWSANAVVVQVFRDITYPLALSHFLRYTYPPRALITQVQLEDGRLRLAADVEEVERAMRSYQLVRKPLKRVTLQGLSLVRAESRYVVVDRDGKVRAAGTATWEKDGHFTMDLEKQMPPGRYTVLAAIYPNGNTVAPEIRAIPYEVK